MNPVSTVWRPASRTLASLVGCALLLAAVVAGGLALAGVTAGSRSRGATPASGPGLASKHTITVDHRERSYLLYRPAGSPPSAALPLVVVLHGAAGSGAQARSSYGWDHEADRGRFLVAYPDGLGRAWAVSDGCCGVPARDGVDDVAFVRAMVDAIAQRERADRSRVYVTGISNGGMLAYRLACATDLFAAIAPVAATLPGTCDDPAPTSVIHIHGLDDRTIPFAGGSGRRDNGGDGRLPAKTEGPPVSELLATWRTVAGCSSPETTLDGVVTTVTAACPDGRAVSLITIAGAGHQWPGSNPGRGRSRRPLDLDPPSSALDATSVIWGFFQSRRQD